MPTTKEPQPTLYEALMNAQQAFGPVLKNATNPHLKSKYADLGAVIETITGPLNDNGLLFFQTIQPGTDVAELVTTIVLVATGDKIESRAPLVSKDPMDPQKFGAALTYMRRYSLLAMCGLAPEDDDGHAATQKPAHREPKPATQQMTADTTTPQDTTPHYDLRKTPEDVTDAQFDEMVRQALATRNTAEYLRLVDRYTGKYTSRWMVLVRNCESLNGLDWIERKANERGIESAGLPIAIANRRAVLSGPVEETE